MATESFEEQVDRLEMMGSPNSGTWDLSENDIAAINAVLAHRKELIQVLRSFLQDPRFQVSIGGNPNAVDAMLKRAKTVANEGGGRGV